MTVFREHESRIAGLPCMAQGCNEPRMKRSAARHSRYCAHHDAVARAQRHSDAQERALDECTLAHLYERWTTHPHGKAGFVQGRRVCGMKRVGDVSFRVTLEGDDTSQVMRGSTRVELRHVKTDGALRGAPL